ncbi:MAG: FAD-dependent monooxygenase [Endozoicomonadaceae bacterium]|nr:FAD-dependent monooxygenase [Endozoicomonadaceae bacterium]
MKKAISDQKHNTDFHYDIVIAGGGLAGLSMVNALSCLSKKSHGRPLSVAVIEPNGHNHQQDHADDPRQIALTYGSKLIYESLGLWDALSDRCTPMKTIHVSERGGPGSARLFAEDYQVPALGYVVAAQHLLEALENRLTTLADITLLHQATVKAVDMSAGKKQLTITQQDKVFSLQTDLVIVAEGGRSSVMGQMGFHADEKDYGHTAILTIVGHSKLHNNVAYERFTDEGSVAMLPLSDNNGCKSALVWTMPSRLAAERLQLTDADFMKTLQSLFGDHCGSFYMVGKRSSFPLKLKIAAEPAQHGAVLLGNSAHSLHPIAGQGYNLTLRDVMMLASLLTTANTQSLGDLSLLQRYLSQQKQDQFDTIFFSDYLIKVFTSTNPLTRFARKAGLIFFDKAPFIKRWFGYRAMGMGGYGQ